MQILVVEDEAEKLRLIESALYEIPGVTESNVVVVHDAHRAKVAINSKKFDLLILDINVPVRGGQSAEKDGGLDVLRFVKRATSARAPTYILGLTAYEESYSKAEADFSWPVWRLLRFSYSDVSWIASLKEAVQFLVSGAAPPFYNDGASYHIDLGIVVALPEEAAPVLDLLQEKADVCVGHDDARYVRGKFFIDGMSPIEVVMVVAPKMGISSAAIAASKLIHGFRPKLLAMCGICAGVRGRANLGDVIVADPTWDWGSGKWREDEKGEVHFLQAPYQWRLDQGLSERAKALGDDKSLLDRIFQSWKNGRPDERPKVIVEAMASGSAVLQSSRVVASLIEQHKNLVGIEMEAFGVFSAAEYASNPKPKCIVAKAVCDFGDEHKNDKAHDFAAYVSANFIHALAMIELSQSVNVD